MNLQTNHLFLWSIIVVLILICAWLVFRVVDQSVTLDHQTQHSEIINKQRDLLATVLNSIGKNIDEVIVRDVLTKSTDFSVFEKADGHLVADQVSFFFSDGKLIKVDVSQERERKENGAKP